MLDLRNENLEIAFRSVSFPSSSFTDLSHYVNSISNTYGTGWAKVKVVSKIHRLVNLNPVLILHNYVIKYQGYTPHDFQFSLREVAFHFPNCPDTFSRVAVGAFHTSLPLMC